MAKAGAMAAETPIQGKLEAGMMGQGCAHDKSRRIGVDPGAPDGLKRDARGNLMD
jgi:hypothetical protein